MKLQYVMIAMAAILGTAAAAEARDVASGLPTGKRMHKAVVFAKATKAIVSPRDAASGLPTGKRMHKPFVVAKESAARINKSKSNVKNNY